MTEHVPDQVGLGWRAPLAADTLANLEQIEVVEVIADDYFDASNRERQALRWLGRQTPLILHGVSLGLASTAPVDLVRLDHMARLIEEVNPWLWSEHLAFVRGGGVEIWSPCRAAADSRHN
ncbi:MAG: multinuclear nonheme iron-dependent oxidase [Acidobacteriota bacterium]